MWNYPAQNSFASPFVRVRSRVFMITTLVLLAATIWLAITAIGGNGFKNRTHESFRHAMAGNVSNAITVANQLESTNNSYTPKRLAMIRQYIYGMEQINRISIQLFGEQDGRFVPDVAFTSLYGDLSDYEDNVQSAKNSSVEIRERLIAHLNLVQGYIDGVIADAGS